MERENLGSALFEYVLKYLEANSIKVGRGTIVDATIISPPRSTKNKDRKRDPDMHQTKQGNQWLFGMKAHIDVDIRTKAIHPVVADRCRCSRLALSAGSAARRGDQGVG